MKQKFTTMLLVTILVLGMGLVQAQDQSEIDKLLNQTKVLQEQLDSFKEKEFAETFCSWKVTFFAQGGK